MRKLNLQRFFEHSKLSLKVYLELKKCYYYIAVFPISQIKKLARQSGHSKRFKRITRLKDIHKKERCFIIGTAGSLNKEDLLKLSDEYTFGVNALCLWFKEFDVLTNYFVMSDPVVYEKLQDDIPDSKKCKVFISEGIRQNNQRRSSQVVFPVDFHNVYMTKQKRKKFTNRVDLASYDGSTVVLHAIQLAVYLGFKEIYLLGVDCNYAKDAKSWYAIDHGIRDKSSDTAGYRMIRDFERIKDYTDQWGVEIYNASRGGMLEVFPRVDLDDVI